MSSCILASNSSICDAHHVVKGTESRAHIPPIANRAGRDVQTQAVGKLKWSTKPVFAVLPCQSGHEFKKLNYFEAYDYCQRKPTSPPESYNVKRRDVARPNLTGQLYLNQSNSRARKSRYM